MVLRPAHEADAVGGIGGDESMAGAESASWEADHGPSKRPWWKAAAVDRRDFRDGIAHAVEEEQAFGHGFLWLALFFVLGAGLWRWLPADPPLAVLLCGLVAAIAGVWGAAGRRRATFSVLTVLLAGLLAAELEAERRAITMLDSPVVTNIVGIVAAREVDHRGHWRYTIDIEETFDPTIGRPPERVRILSRSSREPIDIGERIVGLARLSPPSGPAMPGTFDFAFNAYFNGLGAFGFFYGAPGQGAGPVSDAGIGERTAQWVLALREKIAFRIMDVIEGDPGAVAAAMTVSDRRSISEPTIEAFRETGLAHILSISGLHMSLAAAIMFTGLRLGFALFPVLAQVWPVKKFAALGALASSSFYLVISGAVVSAQRAWIMVAIMLVAVLLDRAALTLRNVAIAAVLIVALAPSAVTGPGFQMSFAATAALIAAYGAWSRRNRDAELVPERRNGWFIAGLATIAGIVVTSLIAGAATGIFSAHHFHRMAGYGMVANIVAMPVISVVVMPMATLSLIAMPFGLDAPFLVVLGWGLEAVIAIAHWVAARGADFATGQIPYAVTALLTAGLVVAVLTRTWLRWFALVPAAVALSLMLLDPPVRPSLLIEEEGEMVAILRAEGLASNRARPSSFIFDQWLSATRREVHLPPSELEPPEKGLGDGGPPVTMAEVAAGLGGAEAEWAKTFICRDDAWCVGRLAPATLVATVEDPAFIGKACDVAAIVITAVRLNMNACRSGAMLITGRTLRQTGAVAIYAEPSRPAAAGSALASGEPAAPQLTAETALGGIVRPWTIHRYYDWRSRSFVEPLPVPGAR